MSTPAPTADQTFLLRPRPPLRGLAISAVAILVGVVVLVAASEFGWPPAASWVGLTLGFAGVLVGVAAWVSARRLRSEIVVRTNGLTVAGARGRTTLPWSEIEGVTAIEHQLILNRTDGGPEVVIINPRGGREPAYPALVEAIRRRMDADRGYRPLT
ncbi:MAG: hypothetical protein ACR2LI_13640 [Propionibacteriaceae bacterium]